MTGETADILTELEGVRRLLLIANRRSMQECESRLFALTTREEHFHLFKGSIDVKKSLANIRFLLNNARDFWFSRQPVSKTQLQYASGGMLVVHAETFSFALEV